MDDADNAGDVLFFATPSDFRKWLDNNHDKLDEQWVGYYKKASGIASITWPESVDQALCYGWIDGLRKSIDDKRYKIRFTPRRPDSIWSAVNLKRIEELIALSLVEPPGLAIYEQRDIEKIKKYSYERQTVAFDQAFLTRLKSNTAAWKFFQALPPSAKKQTIWWVMSAKREETRQRRFDKLLECSENGQRIPQLRRPGK